MPTFTYLCDNEECGWCCDTVVKDSQEKVKCPLCECNMTRLFSPTKAAPKFKGSGFYSTGDERYGRP